MLKEFTQSRFGHAEYYQQGLASKTVRLFLAKEENELASKIEAAVKKFSKKSKPKLM